MAIHVVENANGRPRIVWGGAAVLFLGLFSASAAIPAIGFWLAFGEARLVGMAIAIGFSMACFTLPMLLLQQMSLPLERLPVRTES